MSTTAVTPAAEVVKKTYKYFDLDTFELKSEEVTVTFNKPANVAEAVSRIGNDQAILLEALSAYLKKAALKEGRKSVLAKGAPKKIVFDVIRPLRNLAPWKDIAERKDQTSALLQVVKASPAIIEAIKANAAVDEDEEEGTEENE